MKYYLDTEFHEYQRKPLFSKPFRTIDLISIGIVAEDGREYYAVSKDFDLWGAFWNDWLRDNVLKPIFNELNATHIQTAQGIRQALFFDFSYLSLWVLLRWYGKSNSQIAEEVKEFTLLDTDLRGKREILKVEGDFIYYDNDPVIGGLPPVRQISKNIIPPEFYAYYADYDWVVFCWLFGKMIDLPKGFPMYCIDLKQMLDEKELELINQKKFFKNPGSDVHWKVPFKENDSYPKQSNEHNALADAKWNKELHNFIEKL